MLNTEKCITIVSERRKDGQVYPNDPRVVGQEQGFRSLVEYELDFGACVTHLGTTSVTVYTRILGCEDYTTFSGSIDDMEPLATVAAAYSYVSTNHESHLHALAFKVLETASQCHRKDKAPGVVPLLAKLGGGMVIGGYATRMALAAAYDLPELHGKVNIKGMTTAALLVIDGTPKQDVIDAYLPTPVAA